MPFRLASNVGAHEKAVRYCRRCWETGISHWVCQETIVNARASSYVSCGAERLYTDRSFSEESSAFAAVAASGPAAEHVADLYPAFDYQRPMGLEDAHCGAAFAEHLAASRRHTNRGMTGAASALFRFDEVAVRDRVLHVDRNGAWIPVIETHRPLDRPSSGLSTVEEMSRPTRDVADDGPFFFMGSAGCFNYGHWLTDDLPRLGAFWKIRAVRPDAHIRIALTRHAGAIDEVRQQSIDMLLHHDPNYSITWIERHRACVLRDLYYASPVSYPGVIKSPEATADLHTAAIAALAECRSGSALRYVRASPSEGRRLFIDRGAGRSRGLVNSDAVLAALEPFGFERHTLEGATFADQVALFSEAGIVVGNMGAGMTNTVFTRSGTPIMCLAPEGWTDGFYWDLATVMRHRHIAVYGPLTAAGIFDGFTVDPDLIHSLVQRALVQP